MKLKIIKLAPVKSDSTKKIAYIRPYKDDINEIIDETDTPAAVPIVTPRFDRVRRQIERQHEEDLNSLEQALRETASNEENEYEDIDAIYDTRTSSRIPAADSTIAARFARIDRANAEITGNQMGENERNTSDRPTNMQNNTTRQNRNPNHRDVPLTTILKKPTEHFRELYSEANTSGSEDETRIYLNNILEHESDQEESDTVEIDDLLKDSDEGSATKPKIYKPSTKRPTPIPSPEYESDNQSDIYTEEANADNTD